MTQDLKISSQKQTELCKATKKNYNDVIIRNSASKCKTVWKGSKYRLKMYKIKSRLNCNYVKYEAKWCHFLLPTSRWTWFISLVRSIKNSYSYGPDSFVSNILKNVSISLTDSTGTNKIIILQRYLPKILENSKNKTYIKERKYVRIINLVRWWVPSIKYFKNVLLTASHIFC